ncbi:rhamnose ABC transporter substrate-binding protein [Lichenicola cladoniae]|uniref:Rhamnose ABC transporter substrate-binding protein n=1 Tax=Lichenicola cladoniae TaxID=1484109 RepID=A0A6M8HU24_9PROT|nr:rhamnose ABC transporter substrate-binding protein [Lichenicola cladoniae]NPD67780.1 rhamnose ABC transporter substrate-binding protein [Acetobacteraceae bacterium]QKE91701.1 rhamnose ABC transporter substrate-binding protein [Lichenicola cladoniae]
MYRRTLLAGLGAATAVSGAGLWRPAVAAAPLRIAIVAKSLGIGFFNAVHVGGDEAAKSIGGIEVIFTGPTNTAAENQIDVINALIAQHVDAIAISANDPDALVPACKRALQRGIKVVTYDSTVADGRLLYLADATDEQVGITCNKLASDACGGKGKVAIVSATVTSTNQNAWIAAMKKALPQTPGLDLIATVYGDDLSDKSYREATALLQKYPDLAVIIAPSTVGITASAKAVEDAGKTGKVFVTGLGLPSECAGAVAKGTIKSFAIWNPVDIGYAVVEISHALIKGTGAAGQSIDAGRLGKIAFDAQGNGTLGVPTIYDKSNIDAAAKLF